MKNSLYTVLDPRGQLSGILGRTVNPDSQMLHIPDPDVQPEIRLEPGQMAPWLASLDNKTVYLVNTGFAGAREFMSEGICGISISMLN